VDVEGAVLRPLELLRAEPDPFRSSTMIHFHQSFASRVKIALYDVRGRRVRMLLDEWLDAGEHRIAWDGGAEDGRPLPSGVYLCRLSRGTLMPTVDRPVVLAR
jgi:hypothetical protein